MDLDDLRAAGVTEPIEHFEELLADIESGTARHIAITAPPYGCASAFLTAATDRLESVDSIALTSLDTTTPPDLPDEGVVVISDCHYLFLRRIGGFDAFDSVMQWLVTTECAVITSWNQYAWQYLDQAKDVSAVFTDTIETPTLAASALANLFESRDTGLPEFVIPETPTTEQAVAGRDRIHVTLPVLGRSIEFPVPSLGADTTESTTDAQTTFFEALAAVSGGHPGIAEALWDRYVPGETTSPAAIPEPPTSLELTDDAAIILLILLSNGAIEREVLSRFTDSPDRELYTLVQQGLAERQEGQCLITPSGVASAVTALERRRLVW